jgi:small subunit ribosomal protein S9
MSPERVSVIWATGKRKSSVARVRLQPGDGEIVVNERALDRYFGRETSRMIVHQPFEVTSTLSQYRVDASVRGGGVSAQAVALRHGITRALLQANPELRPALKKAGFLTRDPREVERKKYGRHKARKRPQYSKR